MTITMIDGNMVPVIHPEWNARKGRENNLYAGSRLFAKYEILQFGADGNHTEGVRGWSLDGAIEVIGDTAKEVGLIIWVMEKGKEGEG